MSDETPSPKDLFSVCKENVDKFFNEVEKSTPMYQKSVADLQQKYIDAWKIAIYSAIDVQKEYANKNGMNFNIPEATMRMIRDTTVSAIKAYADQNKISAGSTDATTQAIKTFNANTKSFATLNRNILDSMMLVLTSTTKT